LSHSNVKPIVLEKSDHMGGLSRTVNYKGNRIDVGGHRFFSKSDRVMNWWFQHLPIDSINGNTDGNGNGINSSPLLLSQ
jgi:protoporphyrinogen oxidase